MVFLKSKHASQNKIARHSCIGLQTSVTPVVQVGRVVIHQGTLEVKASVARASACEIDSYDECRIHFPFFLHVLLRDEYGNVCPPDEDQVSVRLTGYVSP